MEDESSRFGIEINSDFEDQYNPFEDSDAFEEEDASSACALSDNGLSTEPNGAAEMDEKFGKAIEVSEESVQQTKSTVKVDTRTPEEKLDELYRAMKPQWHTVLGILRKCQTMQPVDAVNDYVAELQKYNYSVFGSAAICTMLEKAEGIVRVVEDGTPFSEITVEPVKTVDEDGVECIEPGQAPETFWLTTEAGMALANRDDPETRLKERLAADAQFLSVYKQILKMAATEKGALRDDIFNATDATLDTLKPRCYSPLFVDRLYKCDAIEWRNAWYITDLGRQCLESMADVEDIVLPEPENQQ